MIDKKFEEREQVETLIEWSELDKAITRTYEMSIRLREGGFVGHGDAVRFRQCKVNFEHLQKLLEIEAKFFSTIHLPTIRPLPD